MLTLECNTVYIVTLQVCEDLVHIVLMRNNVSCTSIPGYATIKLIITSTCSIRTFLTRNLSGKSFV